MDAHLDISVRRFEREMAGQIPYQSFQLIAAGHHISTLVQYI